MNVTSNRRAFPYITLITRIRCSLWKKIMGKNTNNDSKTCQIINIILIIWLSVENLYFLIFVKYNRVRAGYDI